MRQPTPDAIQDLVKVMDKALMDKKYWNAGILE
jgi:hypothetical protein